MDTFRNCSALIAVLFSTLLAGGSPAAHAEYSAGTAGGPHGKYANGHCDRGEIPVGLRVAGGTYVQAMYLLCSKGQGKPPSEQRVFYSASTADYFSLGNRREEVRFCPEGYAVAGIKARAGTYVDRIMTMRCRRIRGDGVRYIGVGIGGNGGRVVRMYCNKADTVTKLQARYGQWLDQLEVYCG